MGLFSQLCPKDMEAQGGDCSGSSWHQTSKSWLFDHSLSKFEVGMCHVQKTPPVNLTGAGGAIRG